MSYLNLRDFWDSCYSSEHRQSLKPEEFRKTFCEQCMNTGCQNSRGSGTAWAKRVLTQEERLLRNPRFSEPGDPRLRRISEMDFENLLQEALSIEISEARGDWSIPTPQEVGREAAVVLGLTPPVAWRSPEEEPEPPEEDPEPPEKLVDEVTHTDLAGKPTEQQPRNPPRQGSWKIIGDSGNLWEVSHFQDDSWGCTCPAYTHKKVSCKHILDVQRKLQRSSLPEPPVPQTSAPQTPAPQTPAPQAENLPPGIAPVFRPIGGGNTKIPEGGLMVGGGSLKTPQGEDPWALSPTALPTNERVIPVGGKIQFKR